MQPERPDKRTTLSDVIWVLIILALAAFCLCVLASGTGTAQAQAPTTVGVTGHAGDASNNTFAGIDIQFQLANCGNNQPRIFGYFGIVKQVVDFIPDPTTGLITGQIWPNDKINCGGTVGGTFYFVTYNYINVPQGPKQCFVVLSTQNPFNLDTAIPCSDMMGPPGPGAFQPPPPCPTGQFVTGVTSPFGLICTAPGSGYSIQVNGVGLLSQPPANFVDSSSIHFTNTSAGNVTATGLQLQHNGTNLPNQILLNFNDAPPPSLDTGYSSVKFLTDSSGNLGAEYLPGGTAIQTQVTAGPGQYVVIYPTTVATGVTLGDTTYNISPGAQGGQIFMGYAGGVFDCFGLARCEGHLIWSGFSLPSYVNPANVTSVVPFGIYGTNNGFPDSVITVTPSGTSMPNSAGAAFKMGQTNGGTGTTGAQISSTSLSWEVGYSAGIPGPTYLNVASIGLIVYYTGTAPPINNDIQVIPPLYFNQSTFMLGIDPLALSYSNSLTVAGLGPASRSPGEVIPVNDGTGASDCSAGGGSTRVWCYSNGSTWIPFAATAPAFATTTDLTGSRFLTTSYQNTGSTPRYVSGYATISGGSGDSTITFLVGPSSPTITCDSDAFTGTIGGEHVGFRCIVPAGSFYEVTGTNLISGIGKWTETQ